ncbi:MAG: EpsG family protein [Butyrivibrio sp.]|nr:EpsG family protein [Butyrivibrio sp.]
MDYLVYWLLYVWCGIVGSFFYFYLKVKKSKIGMVLIFFPMFLVSALRTNSVGADTRGYFSIFREIASSDFKDLLNDSHELGYVIFNKIISFISSDEQILLIVSSAVIISGIGMFFYKYSDSPFMSAFLYIGLGSYTYMLTPIRQAMAVPFLLWGMYYLWMNRRMKSYILILCATAFHYTSALFIIFPLFFPYSKKKTLIFIFLSTIACAVFYYVGKEYLEVILMNKYAVYASGMYAESAPMGAGVVRIIIFAILSFGGWLYIFKATRTITYTDEQKIYILSAICYIGTLMIFLGYQYFFLARYDVSFWPFAFLLIPIFYNKISGLGRAAMFPFFIIMVTFYMYATYYLRDMSEFKYQDIMGFFY